jgi:uncharacterized membrane protein YfcA
MMLLTKRKPDTPKTIYLIQNYELPTNDRPRLIFAGIGFFISGIAAGLFGIGGGTLNVPIMCFVLGMPMLSATATSVFAILFSSTAGTMMNVALIPQMANTSLFLFYSFALGIGSVFGSKIGADYACTIDGVRLKRFFGAILIFPLVHLMRLGQRWLDPHEVNIIVATLGDLLIWLFIVIPAIVIWKKQRSSGEKNIYTTP